MELSLYDWCIEIGTMKLLDEWNSTRNNDLTPKLVSLSSGKIVWWICNKKHEWQASVVNRKNGKGCPYCANRKVLQGYNDLYTTNSLLADEWHPTKNGQLLPTEIVSGSTKKVWWLGKCGHEWESIVHTRNKGVGCPICANQITLKGINDLGSTNTSLAKEWHPTKNDKLEPSGVTSGSSKKVWWLGNCGHEWKTAISDRNSGKGCPICAGRYVLAGFNDFKSLHPYLAGEWHPTLNSKLDPSDVTSNSNKKVWWLGKCGHEWMASIDSRVRGRGCFVCDKGKKASYPEKAIVFYIKKIYKDLIENYRSDRMEKKELDIYISCINFAVEYDGQRFHKDIEKDIAKNELCEKEGILLLRIREMKCPKLPLKYLTYQLSNNDVSNFEDAIRYIFRFINTHYGKTIDIDINIQRDNIAILEDKLTFKESNSLLECNLVIAAEWHPSKNGNITPRMISVNSNQRVWWLGKCGHEWKAPVSARNAGHGCPYCANKRTLKGFNDLASQKSELLSEWNFYLNRELKPTEVNYLSNRKVWWKCKFGHEWEMSIALRTQRKSGCPYCYGRYAIKDITDLVTVNPELASEWHPSKNGELTPNMFPAKSEIKVWWLGKCGHEWRTTIAHRTEGTLCPYCSNKQVIAGFNDLCTVNPKLALEWHPTKNDFLRPTEIGAGTNKKVWWLGKCGHEWQAMISSRSTGVSCPFCTNVRVLEGYNDLATIMPYLANEWHPDKNGQIKPTEVVAGSGKKVWWLGKCGHEWEAIVRDRSQKGRGCPICAHGANSRT